MIMPIARAGWRQLRRGREMVAAARTCGERHLLARTTPPTGLTSRILCYHSTGTPRWGVNDVTPKQFRRHLEMALEAGYRIVPAAELAGETEPEVGDKRIALTFDDGLRSLLTGAAPVLAELDVPWTVFVVTDWAEGRHGMADDLFLTWEDTQRLASAGATIASHSVTHPDFAKLGPTQAAEELGRSREVIRERLGIDTTEFAIPFGQSGNWPEHTRAAATAAGYRTVYAQSMNRRPAGTVARTFITRFDDDRLFRAAINGAFDQWEEWV